MRQNKAQAEINQANTQSLITAQNGRVQSSDIPSISLANVAAYPTAFRNFPKGQKPMKTELNNRDRYHEITDKMDAETRNAFDNYLVGALWVACDEKQYAAALKTASVMTARRQAALDEIAKDVQS